MLFIQSDNHSRALNSHLENHNAFHYSFIAHQYAEIEANIVPMIVILPRHPTAN